MAETSVCYAVHAIIGVKLETGREIQLRQCNVQLAAFAPPLPRAAWLFLISAFAILARRAHHGATRSLRGYRFFSHVFPLLSSLAIAVVTTQHGRRGPPDILLDIF